jgi:hypothetical protein
MLPHCTAGDLQQHSAGAALRSTSHRGEDEGAGERDPVAEFTGVLDTHGGCVFDTTSYKNVRVLNDSRKYGSVRLTSARGCDGAARRRPAATGQASHQPKGWICTLGQGTCAATTKDPALPRARRGCLQPPGTRTRPQPHSGAPGSELWTEENADSQRLSTYTTRMNRRDRPPELVSR